MISSSHTPLGTVREMTVDVTPLEAARRLHGLRGAAFLDSSLPGGPTGEYSYFTALPIVALWSRARRVEVGYSGEVRVLDADPWDVLRDLLAQSPAQSLPGLPPFQGGAIGCFGYDLGRHVERLPVYAQDDLAPPEAAVGIYDWVLSHDHRSGVSRLVCTETPWSAGGASDERFERLRTLISGRSDPPYDDPASANSSRANGDVNLRTPRLRFRSNRSRSEYEAAVRRVKEHIAAGDCYQVNLSHRLETPWQGDPWTLYEQLRAASPVPYAAYMDLGCTRVLSASPERFLRLAGRTVDARPIKGTRPRSADPEEDRALAAALFASPKDRAENLMIVDLLRNDLGRVCVPGSVTVPGLFKIEQYSNVWQMVSTVAGRLRNELGAVDLLRSAFPGGSVTGAPKIRAMEIIEELEPVRRGPYCGSIAYIGFGGDMDSSIVIRTLIHSAGNLYLQVGGGVVADSDPADEYEETLAKARAALNALDAEFEDR